jgi:hypothetical protein
MVGLRKLALVSVGAACIAGSTAAIAATTTRGSGGGGSVRGFPLGHPACGVVGAGEGTADQWSQVAVYRVRGISCAAARRLVVRCITSSRVPRWRASRPAFTSSITSGRRKVQIRLVSGSPPECLRGQGRTQARASGDFGPYEYPLAYPSKWPAPFDVIYRWPSPVTTYSASIFSGMISKVSLVGDVHNPQGDVLSFWFEYGTTRDALDNRTPKQNPPLGKGDAPVGLEATLLHLNAKTRYFWRAAANIRQPDGSDKVLHGTIGSFVTQPYRDLRGESNACAKLGVGPFQITESLTIVCSRMYHYVNDATKWSPIPLSIGYSGGLSCTRDDPRNLNSGSDSFEIPYIHYSLSLSHLVSYWRSNDSNRFTTFPGNQKNSPGQEKGPVPGWHEWNVDQWGYPFTTTSTDVQFWINCTNDWQATSGEQLARGEGNDVPSDAGPSAPQDAKAVKAADGGIDVSWKPPSGVSPSGVAGYYLGFLWFKKGAPKVLPSSLFVRVITTEQSGHLDPGHIAVSMKSAPAGTEFGVAVAAVSREGSIGPAAILDWR